MKNNYFPFTVLSNDFIENYMLQMNSNFVVIYIYTLKIFMQNENIYIDDIVNKTKMLKSDILLAFDYFKNVNLITFEIINENQIDIIFFPYKNDKIPKNNLPVIHKDKNKEEIISIIRLAEKKLAKPLTPSEKDILSSIYNDYSFSSELLLTLLTFCIDNNKTNFKYIEKIAINWHENNLDTSDKVEQYINLTRNDYRAIMKALGRNLSSISNAEENFIKKWRLHKKMPLDVIVEACDRTSRKTKNASIDYADTILESWLEKNIKNLEDIKYLDKVYSENKKSNIKNPTYKKNKFTNYKQREINYDILREIEIIDLGE